MGREAGFKCGEITESNASMTYKKTPMLSKSKYLAGLQCPLRLWHQCYNPHLAPPVPDAKQALFDTGHEVGRLATRLYQGGVLVETDPLRHEHAVGETFTEDDGMELGKTWHFVHYLITGDAKGGEYPLGYAIMIGYPFDNYSSDLTWRSPDEVKDIAEALANLSEQDLLKRRNLPKASKSRIYDYPAGFKRKDVEEVLPYFRNLRNYYSAAAKKGSAMMVHIG